MNAHSLQPWRKGDQGLAPTEGNPLSASALAKEWRKHPERRREIVQMIDRMDRWAEFRFVDLHRDGNHVLVAIITDADRERIQGATASLPTRLAGGERQYPVGVR